MLNHTTLLFAPNLPRIKRNVNKFALIMAQKSPDNRTKSVKVSSFTAFIHQLLQAWKYCLWLWRFQRPFASVSIIWFWITEELTTSILRPFVKWWKRSTIFLLFSQSIFSFGPHILWVRFWFLLIYKAAAKRSFHLPIIEMPYLDNHTTLLFAQFLPVKNGN